MKVAIELWVELVDPLSDDETLDVAAALEALVRELDMVTEASVVRWTEN